MSGNTVLAVSTNATTGYAFVLPCLRSGSRRVTGVLEKWGATTTLKVRASVGMPCARLATEYKKRQHGISEMFIQHKSTVRAGRC